jgi:putative hemolysin
VKTPLEGAMTKPLMLLELAVQEEGASSAARPARRTAVPAAPAQPHLEVSWARHEDEVREAQRLRYRVFAGEMGARLTPPAGTAPEHDADPFDPHCEHLLVHAVDEITDTRRLVGTYRVLMPSAARRLGGYYTETEFDLAPLAALRPTMAELGRSCVDAQWRTGGVILMMWSHLAQFMHANGVHSMIGCASVPMFDGGHAAASLYHRLQADHLVPAAERVTPRLPLPVDALRTDLDAEPPALVKGYLKCGARLQGAPAWDPDFNTADLPMLLRLADLPASYRRRFLGA